VPRGYPYRRGETGSDRLRQAEWKPSPKTDAEAECEFRYQLEGWTKPYRFIAMRTAKPREEVEDEEAEQYQLFETHTSTGYWSPTLSSRLISWSGFTASAAGPKT
jgi:hypothetical protein